MLKLLLTNILFITGSACSAQGLLNTYYVEYLQGPGTYTLLNGTTGEGKLRFHTRSESMLNAGKGQKFAASEVKSFTIGGHTLVPAGNFDFGYGLHTYRAKQAFIEFVDTAGYFQLALFHTAEPSGKDRVSFATYLVRRRGDAEFITGPNAIQKWNAARRQQLTEALNHWPEAYQELVANEITFENFPAYVRRANQQVR